MQANYLLNNFAAFPHTPGESGLYGNHHQKQNGEEGRGNILAALEEPRGRGERPSRSACNGYDFDDFQLKMSFIKFHELSSNSMLKILFEPLV